MAKKPKMENGSNIVTNLTKTLGEKKGPDQKIFKKKFKGENEEF